MGVAAEHHGQRPRMRSGETREGRRERCRRWPTVCCVVDAEAASRFTRGRPEIGGVIGQRAATVL